MKNNRPKNIDELKTKMKTLFTVSDNGCHEFIGPFCRSGYGKIKFKYKSYFAHRLYWTMFKQDIPDGLFICHKCDNPKCVNIEHLFVGTALDNNLDKINKGRDHNKKKTFCAEGHPYSAENTAPHNGRRKCKTCDRLRHRKDYIPKKGIPNGKTNNSSK